MNVQFDPRIDHYKVLGVKPDASADEIKKAYRRLAKQCHPDSTGGDKAKETRFKEISQAYDVIGDKEKRAQYDAVRSGGAGRFGGGSPGGGFPGGGGGVWDMGDLFSQMFQQGGGRGGNVDFRFTQGNPFGGADPFTAGGPMPGGPGGRGGRRRPRTAARPRPPAERKLRTPDGTIVTQRGNDVYSDVRLTMDQAVLGTVAEVATLNGKAKVKIPPGTSSGVKLRLKGKGPQSAGGTSGDHMVTVQIDVPKHLDEKAKKLLIELMERTKS